MKRKPIEGNCCFCGLYVSINDFNGCYTDTKRHNRILFHRSCYHDYIERFNNVEICKTKNE